MSDYGCLSFSVYKHFMDCEYGALKKLQEKEVDKTTPLLVGNYIHTALESEDSHQNFIQRYSADILAKTGVNKGCPKAPFRNADGIIDAFIKTDVYQEIYKPGEKEVVLTGVIGDIQWKGKIDSLNIIDDVAYVCDFKSVDDIHKAQWDTKLRRGVSFIEQRDYFLQMAIYKELVKQNYDVKDVYAFIFAVSKQTPPDKEWIDFNSDVCKKMLNNKINEVKLHQKRVVDVMMGIVPPIKCGRCEYCRAAKSMAEPILAESLEIY